MVKLFHPYGLALLTTLFFASSNAHAQGEKHSKIEVIKVREKDSRVTLTFKVVPGEKMIINMDGPWKLDVKKSDGITFVNNPAGKDKMQEKIPGFVMTSSSPPAAKSGVIDYQLIAFVCTKDKTLCYRDVHNEKYAW